MERRIPQKGDVWLYKGKEYIIEKYIESRYPDGWKRSVNYVPVVPVDGAPNDYSRTLEDFLHGFEFVRGDEGHDGSPA